MSSRRFVRTNVYVDSFNLYFGCLKGTSFKWLDIAALCRNMLPSHFELNRIRFFTARVQARPHDPGQPARQQAYIRALETLPRLTVHYGQFLVSEVRLPLVAPPPSGPPMAAVIRTEEKGSDVNLATHLLVDAFDDDYGAAVIISDDSDLVEPIAVVRHKFGCHVTVLSPRGRSRVLSKAATRFRRISPAALAASQFPPLLVDRFGTITKPSGW